MPTFLMQMIRRSRQFKIRLVAVVRLRKFRRRRMKRRKVPRIGGAFLTLRVLLAVRVIRLSSLVSRSQKRSPSVLVVSPLKSIRKRLKFLFGVLLIKLLMILRRNRVFSEILKFVNVLRKFRTRRPIQSSF